jgi:hypothetical protein
MQNMLLIAVLAIVVTVGFIVWQTIRARKVRSLRDAGQKRLRDSRRHSKQRSSWVR